MFIRRYRQGRFFLQQKLKNGDHLNIFFKKVHNADGTILPQKVGWDERLEVGVFSQEVSQQDFPKSRSCHPSRNTLSIIFSSEGFNILLCSGFRPSTWPLTLQDFEMQFS